MVEGVAVSCAVGAGAVAGGAVSCGIGGAAFHLAREYGAAVTGIDLSPEMVAIAQERARRADAGGDVTIRADKGLEFKLFSKVLTECANQGVTKMNFATKQRVR